MSGRWQRVKQSLYRGASVTAEKAEELGRIGKKRLDIAKTKQDISRTYTELGTTIYRLWEKEKNPQIVNQEEVQGLMDQIRSLEEDLREKEADLERMKVPSETESGESSASETP